LKGNISLQVIAGIVTIALAGFYFYIDHQADVHASETMTSFVEEARSQGVVLSYSAVDASPIKQSVEITNFAITGSEQEPDIQLGHVVMTGFSWQDLNKQHNKLPAEMNIAITKGELRLKSTMLETSPDLQTVVRILGKTIPFSTQIAYKLNPEQKQLNLSMTQAVAENFSFNSQVQLGEMGWLTAIDSEQTQLPAQAMSEAMNSTLNALSITYKNTGLIEKIRADLSAQTGKTTEQLTDVSIAQMKQLQTISTEHWGPLFTPLIDEMIKFTSDPKQLTLDINPLQPLSSQDIILAFLGGESTLISLIKDANILLTANQTNES